MLLTLITNETGFARRAEAAGIDRIMIDLERMGKGVRQAGRQLFLSNHVREDISRLRDALGHASILVRINPWHAQTRDEIDDAIARGAGIIMLPMVRHIDDAQRFRDMVAGRARTSLLIETRAALEQADDLTSVSGLDEIHIGLNDLSIEMGRKVIFELLSERLLDRIAAASHRAGILFGFGGVTCASAMPLPVRPELILAEQARLRSNAGWLGRSFRRLCETAAPEQLEQDVCWIKSTLEKWTKADARASAESFAQLCAEVARWKSSAVFAA